MNDEYKIAFYSLMCAYLKQQFPKYSDISTTKLECMKQAIIKGDEFIDALNFKKSSDLYYKALHSTWKKLNSRICTCEWCGGQLYENYICTECGKETETK